ncbi:DUF302 domain-containing protein [Cellulophaga sp. Hel_I_12]|uniref:DUF302 domain-containing protein n=1 Tax=Cellulophaga sp. Hel_I_12 TaxID=1249972 RepID=UPI00064820CC|nr:DUF302 domain-containing protein [Cellulophaga sp. Hel_I_12]
MDYYFKTLLENISFDEAIEKTKDALQKEGFGVLTEIDMKATFKKKLSVDLQNYKIIGACNPSFAYQAILKEDKIGTMLPCNVIVQEKEKGVIEVAAVNPVASMQAIKNQALQEISEEVQNKLEKVIQSL